MEENSFAWSPSLSVGHERIDAQHRTLIELVNAVSSDASTDLKESLEFLLRYTFEHFSDEETLMEEAGYPGTDHHRQLHADFCNTVDECFQSLLAGTLDPGEFRRVAYDWVTNHIMTADIRLGLFLRARAA